MLQPAPIPAPAPVPVQAPAAPMAAPPSTFTPFKVPAAPAPQKGPAPFGAPAAGVDVRTHISKKGEEGGRVPTYITVDQPCTLQSLPPLPPIMPCHPYPCHPCAATHTLPPIPCHPYPAKYLFVIFCCVTLGLVS
ncbi:hypothetical protein Pmani_012842 [Petrolisthes manimaculis]|uniref:Uncharacterized protein n=1 Tax=Petrolisthes manimaculis TaxID=1843537 RepID=A0AAE1PZP0_9EUCA|nr:hypothetical protein Pmani_012842 [Petrolisthes manimaculis]